jgi:hypothetical protein
MFKTDLFNFFFLFNTLSNIYHFHLNNQILELFNYFLFLK